jgi:hypothetical protein
MKRSDIVNIIADWGKPEILDDVYCKNYQEWSDNLLFTLETEYGLKLVDCDGNEEPYEPEEGWDIYFAEQDKKDRARDFSIVIENDTTLSRGKQIAKKFLDGDTFEYLAKEHNVTIERIRQIVAKERHRYQKSLKLTKE